MKFLILLFSLINSQTTSNNPARLHKQEKGTSLNQFCRKICPYVIIACVIIICVLLFIALVKYGHTFSTEANNYEHLQQITTR